MGAFYNCIGIPGHRPTEVKEALGRWLGSRGYRLTDESVLFDLDALTERSAFVVTNGRWTLVFFSHWEEERRLIRELQKGSTPLIYLWVYDSDVWGYDLFDAFGFAGSFSSDPNEQQSFSDSEEMRPPADPARVCTLLGLGEKSAAIRAIEKKGAAFKEEICAELCALLGAEPALSSYDELESGRAEALHESWQAEQVLFFNYQSAKAAIDVDLDLHAYELGSGLMPARAKLELSAEFKVEMERMRRRARLTLLLLKPLSFLARLWERVRGAAPLMMTEGDESTPSPISILRTETATRQWVSNKRHGVRVLLPPAVDPQPVSGKPSAVFAFRIGTTQVNCIARRRRSLREVLRKPSRAAILKDDKFEVGTLPARLLVFELERTRQGAAKSFSTLIVVQTGWALYAFSYQSQLRLDPEVDGLALAVVRSFTVDAPKLRGV
jgi:hypothetical protein